MSQNVLVIVVKRLESDTDQCELRHNAPVRTIVLNRNSNRWMMGGDDDEVGAGTNNYCNHK